MGYGKAARPIVEHFDAIVRFRFRTYIIVSLEIGIFPVESYRS